MAEPHLPSLVIEGFRGFKKLELRKLGHVNLLVGKNGVGKSSVLDAVRLYASQFGFAELAEVLNARDELWDPKDLNCLSPLFHGRRAQITAATELSIGRLRFTATRGEEIPNGYDPRPDPVVSQAKLVKRVPLVLVESAPAEKLWWAEFTGQGVRVDVSERPPVTPCVLVSADGLRKDLVEGLWNRVQETDHFDLPNEVLRLIHADVLRVALETGGLGRVRVKLRGVDKLMPLKVLGDGASRIFGLSLALVGARDGFLLIDEFENGLHHSIQQQIWQFVFELSSKLHVQVFATTHSNDCLEAFSKAANRAADVEGVVSRLVEVDGELHVAQYDERLIEFVTREMVEIR